MIVYWILLLIIAFFAYGIGSISTLSIASSFVFHRNLHKIGKKSMFISNFRRLYGWQGFAKLLGDARAACYRACGCLPDPY